MYCTKCNTKLIEGMNFCPSCGTKNLAGSTLGSENVTSGKSVEEERKEKVDNMLVDLLKNEGKLHAVKVCKETYQISLKEAMQYVENLAVQRNITNENMAGGGGCAGVLALFILGSGAMFSALYNFL